jgi:tetratricopeptide (TPR) repeat protein
MSQKNDNFIDKTFTVLADILLKVLPATREEKKAFAYYRSGMSAQSSGDYAEALENYYEALKSEEDPYDRGYIIYNVALIYTNNGEHMKALEYYQQALALNPRLPQALNNIAVIYHYLGKKAAERNEFDDAKLAFETASDYWQQAIRLSPNSYIEAQNWLKVLGK